VSAAVEVEVVLGAPEAVAPRLLNLVLETDTGAGRIVEVEAYGGERDPASHAHRGPTPRTASMFGPPGTLYVYRSYGLHWCANVTTAPEGVAGAVLIRALEPLRGLEEMNRRRPRARRSVELCSGPGRLCAALGVSGEHDGTDLLSPGAPVRLVDDGTPPPPRPLVTTRVGISRARELPWRFAVPDSPWVSRGRPVDA
jgi:DNA-3-methyladenine glycosylase